MTTVTVTRQQQSAIFGLAGVVIAALSVWVAVQQHRADAERSASDAEQRALISCTRELAAVQDRREDLADAIVWQTPAEWSAAWRVIRQNNPLPNCAAAP